jgi:hypothetical protein
MKRMPRRGFCNVDTSIRIAAALTENRLSSQSTTLEKSCLAIGIHKGGSTMLHDFLQIYLNNPGKTYHYSRLDIPSVLFHSLGLTDEEFDDVDLIPRFLTTNQSCCFFGWRNIPMSFLRYKSALSNFPSVVLIRDPRDCVVSAYYSFLKNHCLPRNHNSTAAKEIIEEREKSAGMSIDQWALKNVARFTNELSRIALFMHHNMRIYRYEDIWESKGEFLSSVIGNLGLPFSEPAFQNAFDRINIAPGTDRRGHVRQGKPGDHRAKLSPETIDQINLRYQSLLSFFGYH